MQCLTFSLPICHGLRHDVEMSLTAKGLSHFHLLLTRGAPSTEVERRVYHLSTRKLSWGTGIWSLEFPASHIRFPNIAETINRALSFFKGVGYPEINCKVYAISSLAETRYRALSYTTTPKAQPTIFSELNWGNAAVVYTKPLQWKKAKGPEEREVISSLLT